MRLALALTLLSACGTENSNSVCVCPPVKKYDQEDQLKLASEIKQAPKEAIFPLFIGDYVILRDALRACR